MAAFTLCLAEEERLAEVVKSFPCLYDKTKKGYKEKDAVSNAWNSVADNLDFINDGKRALTCFANLKKKYARKKKEHKNANRSGTSTKALEKAERGLQMYKFMLWMDRFIQPREGRTNIRSNVEKSNSNEEDDDEETIPDENEIENCEEQQSIPRK